MKTYLIYGFLIGLTLASPITRFQECKEALRRIDNTENSVDREKPAHIQMQPHTAGTSKMDPTMQPSLHYTVSGLRSKKDKSVVTNKTSSIEIRRGPTIKYQRRRDLSHLTQKPPKRQTSGKKHRPNKIPQSHSVYNTSSKIQGMHIFNHKLEKGSIIKQLQKRSIDYEDTPNIPYHSPDISYDWDTQENFTENDDSQDLTESVGVTKNTEDTPSATMNENSDPTDSSEPDHISSSESSNLRGSSESRSPMGSNESNSSNESTKSEEPISDVTNNPIVLNEASDSQESSEPNVQNGVFTTPVYGTTNGLSNESWSLDNSSQSNEHNKSSKSSDSSSNESSNASDSNATHSTESIAHSDNGTENNSQNIDSIVITYDIEENEMHS